MADVELSSLGNVIKSAYEGQANTNAYTDAEKTKLAGIENWDDSFSSEIGGALADTDQVLVTDASDSDSPKLSLLSRFWAYIQSKLSGGTITAAAGNIDLSGTTANSVLTQDASGNAAFAAPTGSSGGPTFDSETVTDVAAGSNVTFADDGDGTITMNVSSGSATVGDGDYGDVSVSGGGATWTVDAVSEGVVTAHEAALTVTKSQISDFAEGDYATGAEGNLATTAVQPGDNVSTLTNDAGYITDYTVTEGDVTAHEASLTITKSQISDFTEGDYATGAEGDLAVTAHSWGDHASAGYLTEALADGSALTSSAGTITLPCVAGKIATYAASLTEDVELALSGAPTAPTLSRVVLYATASAADRDISLPAGWYARGSQTWPLTITSGDKAEIQISTDPDGDVWVSYANGVAQ
jgi:predicted XRE-type DNA-binding protein